MNQYPKLIVFSYLLLICVVVWLSESVIHFIIFSEKSFIESIFINISLHEFYTRILVMIPCCMLFLLWTKNTIINEKEKQVENILNNVIPVCITDKNFQIVLANDSYWNIWGRPAREPVKCYDHRPGGDCHTEKCALTQIVNGAKEYSCVSTKRYDNEEHYFIVTAKPFLNSKNEIVGIIESFQDITEKQKLENEKANLVDELQASLKKVKLLSGFLPICASCKKIRDDKGYWNQIESYISDHSEAEFSHGLCEECSEKLYGDTDWFKKVKKKS